MRFKKNDLLWILPLALALGAGLSSLQSGNWLIGWLGFSFLLLLSFIILKAGFDWAGSGRILAWIMTLAFVLRLAGGVATYVFLPLYGYADSRDGQAGYTFTDAHRRDEQAWGLATSDKPVLDAFTADYSSDQYGGLLALSALVYRYLSLDAHRPLMMVLFAAFTAALGIPFLWKAARLTFGDQVAWASAWIFALYPESILLGGSAMREPYLMTLSAIAFWAFTAWRDSGRDSRQAVTVTILGLSLFGMLLFSPAVAVMTLIIFAGWLFFSREGVTISWRGIAIFAIVFMIGLFALSSSLNRKGIFDTSSPMSVLNDWIQLSVKWNVYQIERESGWVQKLFDEMPEALRMPFVAVYGLLQPVLPAAVVVPTLPIWKVIYVLRALGWYALLPLLILSTVAGSSPNLGAKRSLIVWLALLSWTWILLASLRGGGDQWDNPRYRMLLFVWQAVVAGQVYVWWRETRNAWFPRVAAGEIIFVLIFGQWYASRYFYLGGQLPFVEMVGLIVVSWAVIAGGGWWLDRQRALSRRL